MITNADRLFEMMRKVYGKISRYSDVGKVTLGGMPASVNGLCFTTQFYRGSWFAMSFAQPDGLSLSIASHITDGTSAYWCGEDGSFRQVESFQLLVAEASAFSFDASLIVLPMLVSDSFHCCPVSKVLNAKVSTVTLRKQLCYKVDCQLELPPLTQGIRLPMDKHEMTFWLDCESFLIKKSTWNFQRNRQSVETETFFEIVAVEYQGGNEDAEAGK